jgi:hypothetical protein
MFEVEGIVDIPRRLKGSENRNILNRILINWPKGTVGTLKWFRDHGGYQQLLNYYQKAPWVTKIGSGAYIQYGEPIVIAKRTFASSS